MPLRVRPREKLLPDVLVPDLIAPCGMDCGLCMRYVRDKNGCIGCRAGDEGKTESCLACTIRNCEVPRSGESAFCSSDCERFPCPRLKRLDARYRMTYRMSMLDNLHAIRDQGVEAFGLLGYAGPEVFSARWHSALPDVVHLNEKVRFEIDLANESDGPAQAVVIMRLEFPGRGSAVRTSTYQIWRGTLAPAVRRTIGKTIHFADKSRQPIVPGTVGARVRVSGADALVGEFRLTRGT